MTSKSLGFAFVALLVLVGCAAFQQSLPLATGQADPLPRSPKGYELYSWVEDGAGEWRYRLVTGTNRLKTYEEIILGESEVTGGDWVSLTARGTGELNALLARLPSGEHITWIGEEWPRRAGLSPGKLRFPEHRIVSEVEDYCRQRDIRLEVAH